MKLKVLLLGLMVSALSACGGDSDSTSSVDTCADLNSDTFDCATSLLGVNSVAVATILSLESSLVTLSGAVDGYCANTSDNALLETAQDAFKASMTSIQMLEVMQFGPYADARNDFYIWPNNSLCRIDEQIATDANAAISSIDKGKRGLTAVEYLLFSQDVAMQCGSLSSVSDWVTETTFETRRDARCAYAKRVVDDLEVKVTSLKSDQTDFSFESALATLQQGANDISDALFYVDTETKDAKVKAPLPATASAEFDASLLESLHAHISIENIENNLLGARLIIEAGLDNYLTAKGQSDLSSDMIEAINGALANIAEIDGSLESAILAGDVTASECINLGSSGTYDSNSSDLEAFCALQWNIKTFTDLLKEDFVLALDFTKPSTAYGDND